MSMKSLSMRALVMWATAAALSCAGQAYAAEPLQDGEAVFSYCRTDRFTNYGGASQGTYDLATFLPGDIFEGKTIRRLRVDLDVTTVANLRLWLSTELTAVGEEGARTFVPDISSVNANVADGTVEVILPEPYTVGAEGVYAGFSFDVQTLDIYNSYPVRIAKNDVYDGSCFIRFNVINGGAWLDNSEGGSLPISVVAAGFDDYAAELSSAVATVETERGTESAIPVKVMNFGTKGIRSLDYEVEIDGLVTQGSHTLALPIGAELGAYETFSLPLPAMEEAGSREVRVRVTAIDGEPNARAGNLSFIYRVLSRTPKRRAVVEEYTGTWCGWCPRGYVAMEALNRLYGDDFIGIAYHNGDAMATYIADASSHGGYPSAVVDRDEIIDPISAEYSWNEAMGVSAPADIDVDARLTGNGMQVEATATVVFPVDVTGCDYSLEFVLQADSLQGSGSGWSQRNYYYSYSPEAAADLYPEFLLFYGTQAYVTGLKFNDVAILTSRSKGLDAAVASSAAVDEELVYSYTFDLAEAVNTSGVSLVQNVRNLKVAVLLIDNTTGRIANANKARVGTATGIGGTSAVHPAADASPAAFYDLSGRRLQRPARGVNIVKKRDGTVVKTMN